MAECTYCKTQTELYENGLPICVPCADLSPERRAIRAKLFLDLSAAIKHADDASDAFMAITTGIPSGASQPGGTQQIHNVSHALSEAREAMMKAHSRLSDFLEKGIVPDDLKRIT